MPSVSPLRAPLAPRTRTLPAAGMFVLAEVRRPSPERYETLRVLGRGGMGEVRLVLDRHLGRVVAYKTLRQDVPFHRSHAERLLREALVQARLQHPAIVPVYDVGEGPGGETFFTMKLIRGPTISSLLGELSSGRLLDHDGATARRLLAAFGTVCLAVAHRARIVHRDLKPDNVMLGEFGEVWVLDWGVAKALPGRRPPGEETAPFAGTLDVTEVGRFVGTPGYMAPEQIRDLDEVDERSDVYSLGAMLFEILALEPLHAGDTIEHVIQETIQGADARLAVRAPTRPVRPALEEVCLRATAHDPADRYADARALFTAFDRSLR